MSLKMVFLDCDGTLTKVRSSWEYLHRRLNLWNNKADAYQDMFRQEKIGYEEFCRRDALLWKGLPVSAVNGIVSEIPLQENAARAIQLLRSRDIRTVIISSGLSFLVNRIKAILDIDEAYSNELLEKTGFITGDIRINVPYNGKAGLVQDLMLRHAVDRKRCCAIGDGDGDFGMFGEVDFPVHLLTSTTPSELQPEVELVEADLLKAVTEVLKRCA